MNTVFPGAETRYDVVVRRADGKMFYKEATIPKEFPPAPEMDLDCPDCMEDYKKALQDWEDECQKLADYYIALTEYNRARCDYCMANKNNEIEEKYRTGEPQPKNIEEANKEIKKLRDLIGG